MDFIVYIILAVVFLTLLFGVVLYALGWSVKNGQFKNLEQGSRVVFEPEEPEGMQTDFFPESKRRKRRKEASK